MRPNFYGTDGDQDHVGITRGKVRAKQPSKKKTPRGYKKPQKQLQAPARKISSKPSSESSEYDEESGLQSPRSTLNNISDSVHCNPLTQFTVSSGFSYHTIDNL